MNIGKTRTIEFIDILESFSRKANEGAFYTHSRGEKCNEKQYLEHLVKEARELIKYNEWHVALENTVDNLLEIDYKLDSNVLDLASAAFKAAANESDRLKLIDSLRK